MIFCFEWFSMKLHEISWEFMIVSRIYEILLNFKENSMKFIKFQTNHEFSSKFKENHKTNREISWKFVKSWENHEHFHFFSKCLQNSWNLVQKGMSANLRCKSRLDSSFSLFPFYFNHSKFDNLWLFRPSSAWNFVDHVLIILHPIRPARLELTIEWFSGTRHRPLPNKDVGTDSDTSSNHGDDDDDDVYDDGDNWGKGTTAKACFEWCDADRHFTLHLSLEFSVKRYV